jgi:hypothetical protein
LCSIKASSKFADEWSVQRGTECELQLRRHLGVLARQQTNVSPLGRAIRHPAKRRLRSCGAWLRQLSEQTLSVDRCGAGKRASTKSCQSTAAETEHTVRANAVTVVAALARKRRRLSE